MFYLATLSQKVWGASDPRLSAGSLVTQARWTDRLPHEGVIELVLSDVGAKDPIRSDRSSFESSLRLPGFRPGARHLPGEYVEGKWARRLEGHVARLAMDALKALEDHLGARLLDPIPEVVAHSNPLSDYPFTVVVRLRLHPDAPNPLAGDQVWPLDPARELLRSPDLTGTRGLPTIGGGIGGA